MVGVLNWFFFIDCFRVYWFELVQYTVELYHLFIFGWLFDSLKSRYR